MNNNLHWVEKVLKGLEEVKKVMPDETFIQRMEHMAIAYVQEAKSISMPWIYSIAASFAFLVVLNIAIISNNLTPEQLGQNIEVSLQRDYMLVPAKSLL